LNLLTDWLVLAVLLLYVVCADTVNDSRGFHVVFLCLCHHSCENIYVFTLSVR